MIGRTDEVRMWLLGGEKELRPITASDTLKIRKSLFEKSELFGDDEVSRRILLGALTAVEGVYEDGERAFSDENDVLENLTAEEILAILDEYGEASVPEKNKTEEATEVEDAFGYKRQAEESGEGEKKKEADLHPESNESIRRRHFEVKQDGEAIPGGTSERYFTEYLYTAVSPQKVSDFFEKDSRRYIKEIEIY